MLDTGDWARAIPPLEELVGQAPSYATARTLLGAAYIEARRRDEARSMLESAVELAPGDERAAVLLCELLRGLGEHDSARALCAHLRKLRPLDLAVLDLQAQIEPEVPEAPAFEQAPADDADRWIAAGARAVEEILGPPAALPEEIAAATPLLSGAGRPPNPAPPDRPPQATAPEPVVAAPPVAPPPSLDDQLLARADPPIETLTMADIYVEQGLYDQAMKIYRKQAQLRPNDDTVAQRIQRLEERLEEQGNDRSSTAPPSASGV